VDGADGVHGLHSESVGAGSEAQFGGADLGRPEDDGRPTEQAAADRVLDRGDPVGRDRRPACVARGPPRDGRRAAAALGAGLRADDQRAAGRGGRDDDRGPGRGDAEAVGVDRPDVDGVAGAVLQALDRR